MSMFNGLEELYQEMILDHGRNPRNHRIIENSTCLAHGNNPLCGDIMIVFLSVNSDEIIKDISFKGNGCAISIASASIMTELLNGKTKKEAEVFFNIFQNICTKDDFIIEENNNTDRLQLFVGIKNFPIRVKCATLAWHTMNAALNNENEATTE